MMRTQIMNLTWWAQRKVAIWSGHTEDHAILHLQWNGINVYLADTFAWYEATGDAKIASAFIWSYAYGLNQNDTQNGRPAMTALIGNA